MDKIEEGTKELIGRIPFGKILNTNTFWNPCILDLLFQATSCTCLALTVP